MNIGQLKEGFSSKIKHSRFFQSVFEKIQSNGINNDNNSEFNETNTDDDLNSDSVQLFDNGILEDFNSNYQPFPNSEMDIEFTHGDISSSASSLRKSNFPFINEKVHIIYKSLDIEKQLPSLHIMIFMFVVLDQSNIRNNECCLPKNSWNQLLLDFTLDSVNINYLSAGAYRYFYEFPQLILFHLDFDQISININLNHHEYINNNNFKFNFGYHNFELTLINKFLIQKSLKKIIIGIECGELKLIPITGYTNSNVKEAIEFNQRKHIDIQSKNLQNERNSNFTFLKPNYQIKKDHLGSTILVTGQSGLCDGRIVLKCRIHHAPVIPKVFINKAKIIISQG
ncbi:hypothetical protein ACTFIV_010700 [Dictyostelium citrinum]